MTSCKICNPGYDEAKGSLWLDVMMLLARRPNSNLAYAAAYSVIDSVLPRCESLSEENPQHY